MRSFTSRLQLVLFVLDLFISCMIFKRRELTMPIAHRRHLRDANDGKSQKKIYYTFVLCFHHTCYNYQGLLFTLQLPEIVNIMNQTAVHSHFGKPQLYMSNFMLH